VDNLLSYDISDNILNLPARATIGQMLQYPSQRKNLVKILKHTKTPVETNYLVPKEQRKTTAAKCYIRIKGNPVVAILDSGAAVSIITNKLIKKLGLEPDTSSKTVVITANGTRTRALGQITKLRISIQNMLVPVTLQVIESREETLLLETNWLHQMKAKWDFNSRQLQIQYQGRTIQIETTHFANTPPKSTINYDTEDDGDDEDELIDEIEYEAESDLDEHEAYTSDLVFESDDENPAIFLSDLPEIKDTQPEPTTGVLTKEQHIKVQQILADNKEVFADSIFKEGQTSNLGRTTVVTHTINTGDAMPIKQRPYKASPDQQEFIKKEIEEMLQKLSLDDKVSES